MASDNLNEIGKYIQKTRKDTDYALTRYHATIPKVERTRDVFDSEIPFEMGFETEGKEQTVTMNLIFNLPPPLGDCNTDCLQATCQTFDVTPGDHLVTVDNPYNAGSVTVFVDYVQSLPSGFEEVSPGAGTVFVQGSETTSKITVCYTYGDCNTDFDNEPCPPLDPTKSHFIGLADVFTDNFSRTGSPYIPSGGCGYYADSAGGGAHVFVTNGGGSVRAQATFANHKVASANVEAVFKLNGISDFGGAIFTSTLSYVPITSPGIHTGSTDEDTDGNPGYIWEHQIDFGLTTRTTSINLLVISGQPTLIWGMPFTYINIDGNDRRYGSVTKSVAIGLPTSPDVFIRIAQEEGVGLFFRIWGQDEEEPSFWTQTLSLFDNDPPAGSEDVELFLPIVAYVGVFSVFPFEALSIWTEPGQGGYNAPGIVDESWNLDICLDGPHNGMTYFGFCSGGHSTNVSSTADDLDSSWPSYSVGCSWPHFVSPDAGLGLLQDTHQHIKTFECQGNPQFVRVTGLIRSDNVFGDSFRVNFLTYDFGGAYDEDHPPPATGFEYSGGIVAGSANSPGDGSYGSFDVLLPVADDGRLTWGIAFADGAAGVAGALGSHEYHAPFLSVNNTGVGAALRNVKIEAVGSIDCSTGPFCPDSIDDYNARCGDVDHIFNGPSFSSFCTIPGTESPFATRNDSWTSSGGTYVNWHRTQGVALDITADQDIARLSYNAFGVTTTGLDGRCPRKFSSPFNAAGTRSTSDATGTFEISSPLDCTALGAETIFEFRTPKLIPAADWTSNVATTVSPEFDLNFYDNNFLFSQFSFSNGFSELFISGTQSGNQNLSNPINESNVWYTVKVLSDQDLNFKLKVWKSDDAEPSTWLFEDTLVEPLSNISLEGSYSSYVDDNFFVEFRNVSVTGYVF